VFYAGSVNVNNPCARILTKLSSERTILCNARPVVRPGLIPVCTDTDHGLNSEAHSGLRCSDRLVLRIMRNVGCAVEKLVDAVSTVGPDYAAVLALCMLLDDIAVVTEESARLDHLDSLSQAFSRCLRYAYCIRVCQRLVANVVCLVEITVEAAVVEGHIDVEDVAVLENSLIGDTVANNLVD
jgi:hypothetical protein